MAIFEAATAVAQKGGKVFPHIMIPLVGIVDELESQTEVVRQAAFAVSKATGERARPLPASLPVCHAAVHALRVEPKASSGTACGVGAENGCVRVPDA